MHACLCGERSFQGEGSTGQTVCSRFIFIFITTLGTISPSVRRMDGAMNPQQCLVLDDLCARWWSCLVLVPLECVKGLCCEVFIRVH